MKLKLFLASLFFCVGATAQTFDAPGLAPFCPTATQYSATQQPDMAGFPPPYNTLLYAKTFACSIPVSCTLCKVTLAFFENRLPPIIGVGQRLFTVSLNGGVSEPIDLFSIAGPQTPYTRAWTVAVYDRKLKLNFNAALLNALLTSVNVQDALVSKVYCGDVDICVYVDHEIPMGERNGVNVEFTLLTSPYIGSEHVFVNGVLLTYGDYAIRGGFITLAKAPAATDLIQVNYRVLTSQTVSQ